MWKECQRGNGSQGYVYFQAIDGVVLAAADLVPRLMMLMLVVSSMIDV
nr:hypothetical protein [Bacillus sp. SA1-12]